MDSRWNGVLKYSNFLNAFLLLSVVYFVVAGLDWYRQIHPSTILSIRSSLMERNLAIKGAKETGRSNYTFETGFTPGLGMTSGSASTEE